MKKPRRKITKNLKRCALASTESYPSHTDLLDDATETLQDQTKFKEILLLLHPQQPSRSA